MREGEVEATERVATASAEDVRPTAGGRWRRVALRVMLLWLAIALIVWAWALLHGQPPQLLYPFLWLGLVGLPVWRWRRRIERATQGWRAPGLVKFMALGYLMVLAEEVFSGLVANLSEGFSWPLFFIRVGQFWAFNLLAFTGLFFGWYILVRKVGYCRGEIFFITGFYGLIGEHVLIALPGQPLQTLLFMPLTIFTYGLIITPAMLSAPVRAPRWPWLARYPLGVVFPYLCAVPPVVLLAALRAWRPEFFPPHRFIP